MTYNNEKWRNPEPYRPEGSGDTCAVGQQGYDCYNRGESGPEKEKGFNNEAVVASLVILALALLLTRLRKCE